MRLQPERSQNWELILDCEIKRLQNVAWLTGKVTAERSTQTPQEISVCLRSLNLEIKVDNKEKTLELETLVTRLQNAMAGFNVDLHRQLDKESDFKGPHHWNHCTKTGNNSVIYDNLKEEGTNEYIFHQEKPDSISSHESTLERANNVCHMAKQKGYSNRMVEDEFSAPADGYASWLPLSEYRNRILNGLKLKDEKSDVQSAAGKLTATFDSVLQENAECKCLISKLEEEKRTLQAQFNEMEVKRKICIEEFNSLLWRHEDLQKQNQELEAERQQLIIEKESFIRLVDKMMEEKEDLLSVIGAKETVLQLEKTKEAVQAVNTNALQFENLQMNQSINELQKEITFLRNELEKASCEMQCTKAKYAVMRSKNLMLFQLVKEVKNKNYKLEKSLQNSVTASKCPKKDVDVKIEESTMKEGSLNEIDQEYHGKNLAESCSSDLVKKCAMMSKVVEILTEENQVLNQDLEKYIKANLKLECIVRMLNEEWQLWGKHAWSTEQEMNFLHPEMRKVHASYLSDINNAIQFSHQRKEDEMPDNQLNLSDISLNVTDLSISDGSEMAFCSSPKVQSNIDETGREFKELHEEQKYRNTIQQDGTISPHSTAATEWKTWNTVGGSGDASQIMKDPNLPLLCTKQHYHGFNGKSASPHLEKESNWRSQNLECGFDATLKTPDFQS
ncbi:girdin-like [Stegostoma tigrinum]|uniref:girdin-like n=1 Tax=Stegostoma tigrinum TaxID=3053191 RepID=UPI00202B0434|nr:girdin-like [Stegostoma tigrinum]